MKPIFLALIVLAFCSCGVGPSSSADNRPVLSVSSAGGVEAGVPVSESPACASANSILIGAWVLDSTHQITFASDCTVYDASNGMSGTFVDQTNHFSVLTPTTVNCSYSITDVAQAMAAQAASAIASNPNIPNSAKAGMIAQAIGQATQQYAGQFDLSYNCGAGYKTARIHRH